jgi:hypothetical protein
LVSANGPSVIEKPPSPSARTLVAVLVGSSAAPPDDRAAEVDDGLGEGAVLGRHLAPLLGGGVGVAALVRVDQEHVLGHGGLLGPRSGSDTCSTYGAPRIDSAGGIPARRGEAVGTGLSAPSRYAPGPPSVTVRGRGGGRVDVPITGACDLVEASVRHPTEETHPMGTDDKIDNKPRTWAASSRRRRPRHGDEELEARARATRRSPT